MTRMFTPSLSAFLLIASMVLLAMLPLVLVGCDGSVIATDTDDVWQDTDEFADDLHACEVAKMDAFDQGEAWSPEEVEACYVGCETAEATAAFDQGRLVCLTGGDYCPACIADQSEGEAFQLGYAACYAVLYDEGYITEGCEPA